MISASDDPPLPLLSHRPRQLQPWTAHARSTHELLEHHTSGSKLVETHMGMSFLKGWPISLYKANSVIYSLSLSLFCKVTEISCCCLPRKHFPVKNKNTSTFKHYTWTQPHPTQWCETIGVSQEIWIPCRIWRKVALRTCGASQDMSKTLPKNEVFLVH